MKSANYSVIFASGYNLRETILDIADFDFYLPPELIAQHATLERSASRLMHVANDAISDLHFRDLPQLLEAGDLLVFNDTKVIKARLFGKKETGGEVEVLIERVLPDGVSALAHVRASKSPKPGSRIIFAENISAIMAARHDDLFELQFKKNIYDILEQQGHVPLPPYITHQPDADDESRYQTVYAKHPGSVAAPTAGLHFDEAMLAQLQQQGIELAYVTLHVGAGTFQPVRDGDISKHIMHSERYEISEAVVNAIRQTKARGGRVIAVGTTSLRTLEAASQSGTLQAQQAETKLFITPGYKFKTVDCLITNFHLPRSTLLMLVSAFAGTENIQRAYWHAVAERYRFFSYGDAMLLEKWPETLANIGFQADQ